MSEIIETRFPRIVTTDSQDNSELADAVVPSGTKSITNNGTGIDVAEYAKVDVNVSSEPDLREITIVNNTTQAVMLQGGPFYLNGKATSPWITANGTKKVQVLHNADQGQNQVTISTRLNFINASVSPSIQVTTDTSSPVQIYTNTSLGPKSVYSILVTVENRLTISNA